MSDTTDGKELSQAHEVSYLDGSKTSRRKAIDLTPMKAIRMKCIDCSGGSRKEVELCVIPECPLYPYRMGRKPQFKGIVRESRKLTDEQRAFHAGILDRARSARVNSDAKLTQLHVGNSSADQ